MFFLCLFVVLSGIVFLFATSKAFEVDHYDTAQEWLERGNDQMAAISLAKAAPKGHVTAQMLLGIFYIEGRGVEQNYAKGIIWLEQAANSNSNRAQNYLGNLYLHGQGVEQDLAKAKHYFEMAAKQNNADAKASLAIMYEKGMAALLGDSKDHFEKRTVKTSKPARPALDFPKKQGQNARQEPLMLKEVFEHAIKTLREAWAEVFAGPPAPQPPKEEVQQQEAKEQEIKEQEIKEHEVLQQEAQPEEVQQKDDQPKTVQQQDHQFKPATFEAAKFEPAVPAFKLPPALQKHIDVIEEKTQIIQARMANDLRYEKEGTHFLERYQPAVDQLVEQYHVFIKNNPASNIQHELIEKRMLQQLERISKVFCDEHHSLLKNDVNAHF